MKGSYAETFFRHRAVICVPLLVTVVVSVGYGLQRPRSYVSAATVWTDAPIPNDSTINTGGGTSPPSASQMAVATELLHTHSFLLAVGRNSPMAGFLARQSRQSVDSALASLAKNVTVTTPGPQVIGLAVKQSTPALAVGVTKALVDQFIHEEVGSLRQRADALVQYDQQQVDATSKVLADAKGQLLAYLQAHPPVLGSQPDSTGSQLTGTVALAQEQYATAQKGFSKDAAALAHVADASVLRVLDEPSPAIAQGKKKTLLFAGVGGLLAGGVVAILAMVILMAGDKSARQESDIEDMLALRVVGTLGQLPTAKRRRQRTA